MADTPWESKQAVPSDYETELIALAAGFDPDWSAALMGSAELEDFHFRPHRMIFAAMKYCWKEHGEIDPVAVKARLKDQAKLEPAGGDAYFSRVATGWLNPEKVAQYVGLLRDLRVRRELMEMAGALYERARVLEGSPGEAIAGAVERLQDAEALCSGGGQAVTLEDVADQLGRIEWLWPGWLPLGHMSMLCAPPGVGKSALSLDIAKKVTTGEDWPDGMQNTSEPSSVVYCDTESSHAFLVERAKAWGIPLDRIVTPGRDGIERITLDDPGALATVRRAVREHSARLVVVDSLRGALAGDENTSDVAEQLGPWCELAQAEGFALLMVHHSRKGSTGRGAMHMDAVRGSSALVALARSIVGLTAMGQDEGVQQIRVEQVKSNFAPVNAPRLAQVGAKGVRWLDRLPGEVLAGVCQGGEGLQEAANWLLEQLKDGPRNAGEMRKQCAEACGVGERTVQRAARSMGLRSVPDPAGENRRHRAWALPEAPEQPR